jgi:hypothetical protein
MMEALRSSETSGLTRATQRHVPEDGIFQAKVSVSVLHMSAITEISDNIHRHASIKQYFGQKGPVLETSYFK